MQQSQREELQKQSEKIIQLESLIDEDKQTKL